MTFVNNSNLFLRFPVYHLPVHLPLPGTGREGYVGVHRTTPEIPKS
jgi:hypothetical protein